MFKVYITTETACRDTATLHLEENIFICFLSFNSTLKQHFNKNKSHIFDTTDD